MAGLCLETSRRNHDHPAPFPAGRDGHIGHRRIGTGQLVPAGGPAGADPGPVAAIRRLRQRHPDPHHRHPRAAETDLVPRAGNQHRRGRGQGPRPPYHRHRFPEDVRHRAEIPRSLCADLPRFRRAWPGLWPDGRGGPHGDRGQGDPRRAARQHPAGRRRHLARLDDLAQDPRAGHGQRDEPAGRGRHDQPLGMDLRHRTGERDRRIPALPLPGRQHLRRGVGRAGVRALSHLRKERACHRGDRPGLPLYADRQPRLDVPRIQLRHPRGTDAGDGGRAARQERGPGGLPVAQRLRRRLQDGQPGQGHRRDPVGSHP